MNKACAVFISLVIGPVYASFASIPQEAAASLTCMSLQFQPVTATGNGLDYGLKLTSLTGAEPPNGELFPISLSEASFSYGSNLILEDPILQEAVTGQIMLYLPPVLDANTNAVPDFFEPDQAVAPVDTKGEYFTDVDQGTITARWSRAAGSSTGSCRLRLVSMAFGQLPDFNANFDLMVYRGTLDYLPGTNSTSGIIKLLQDGPSSNLLSGNLLLLKSQTNLHEQFTISAGQWTNSENQTFKFVQDRLDRIGSTNFFGFISFEDWNLSTSQRDYSDWFLLISDSYDTNRNGIPDLSDDPMPNPNISLRFKSIRVQTNTVFLDWEGPARLDSSDDLKGSWSQVVQGTNSYSAPLLGTKRFYRLAK